jgi:hypothetical protein
MQREVHSFCRTCSGGRDTLLRLGASAMPRLSAVPVNIVRFNTFVERIPATANVN